MDVVTWRLSRQHLVDNTNFLDATDDATVRQPNRYHNVSLYHNVSPVLPVCHLEEVTFPPLPQPIKPGTRLWTQIDARLSPTSWRVVTYQGGVTAQRRSPIAVLTGLNVE